MIKKVDCLKFIYECSLVSQEIAIESNIQLTAQTPKDISLLERAILVKLNSIGDDGKFKLICECRVIFAFDNMESLVEKRELLQMHQSEAYNALRDLVNKTLTAMGQGEAQFPIIDFD